MSFLSSISYSEQLEITAWWQVGNTGNMILHEKCCVQHNSILITGHCIAWLAIEYHYLMMCVSKLQNLHFLDLAAVLISLSHSFLSKFHRQWVTTSWTLLCCMCCSVICAILALFYSKCMISVLYTNRNKYINKQKKQISN